MQLYVEGVALLGPGLNGWEASRPVLAGELSYRAAALELPSIALLPPNERRRTVKTVKLALALGAEAFAAADRHPAETPTVFTSSGGDGDTIHEILDALASDKPALSPTRFHNSVHNAPSGYWGIATRSHAASTSLCCHDASFAAGLLEASVQATVDRSPVALIAYDLCYPEPLHSVRPIGATFGAALILAPQPNPAAFARLELELRPSSGPTRDLLPPALEALRCTTPAARSLPLLCALAGHDQKSVAIDYLSGLELALAIHPLRSGRSAESDQAHPPGVVV